MGNLKPIIDSDMDSMFVLPLALIPLQTPSLQKAKLIKNTRLKSVVEFFSGSGTGAGHVEVSALPKMLGWLEHEQHPDMAIINKLSLLPSYDVYSLRISLRELGVLITDSGELRLSSSKSEELNKYMASFTRPLMLQIYAGDMVDAASYEMTLQAFRAPDVQIVRQRLEQLANKLRIRIHELPGFLEDYGDVYLSIGYFRNCLERLTPYFTTLLNSLSDIQNHFQLKQNANLMRSCKAVEKVVLSCSAKLSGRMELFDKMVAEIWTDITPEKFREVREMIKREHVAFGAVLCGLTVKMNAFAAKFPEDSVGGPVQRGDFIATEIRQGLELIQHAMT